MSKKSKKVQKKRNKNIIFIYALVTLGVVLIGLSIFDMDTMKKGASAFGGDKVNEKRKFQPSNTKKDMPGKLMWGRDF